MKRTYLFPTFFLCLIVAVGIFFLFGNSNSESIHQIVSLIQKPLMVMKNSRYSNGDQLKQENADLKEQVQLLVKENQAFRDQFNQNQESRIMNQGLLPASVVGMPGFFPGGDAPAMCIIDKGKKDGVYVGQPVVIKDILLGTVVKTTNFFSQVRFTLSSETYLAVKTTRTGALGILRGKGGSMTLENVVLSDSLSGGDTVSTIGNLDTQGKGIPSDLIIGTISSVERNPSALFQKANVKPLVDVTKLSTVFLVKS